MAQESIENIKGAGQEQGDVKYQSVESINIKKVFRGDPGYNNAMAIYIDNEPEGKDIEKMVRDQLKNQHWWMNEYWQEKGFSKEQVDIRVGESEIILYNFGETLSTAHFEELKKAMEDFSRVDGGRIFNKKVAYILIDNERPLNSYTGEESRGHSPGRDGAIKIYPRGTELGDYREEETTNFEGTSNFRATLIHEFAHPMQDMTGITKKWIEKFGWSILSFQKRKKLPGGAFKDYEILDPKTCVSEYAKCDPWEDVCESVAAAATNPDSLDPKKLLFIKNMLLKNNEPLPILVTPKDAEKITLPKINPEVRYKIIKNKS